jgi:dihydropteroate synthase
VLGKSNGIEQFVLKSTILDFAQPIIMGIVNVTPDSFYDGGQYHTIDAAISHALQLNAQGATIIDIGGQSTKPGATQIPWEQEWERVQPVIQGILNKNPRAIISIDTFYSQVAKLAVQAGASIVNDISAGNIDHNMLATVASLEVPYILMHMQGTPSNMQLNPSYDNVLLEVYKFMQQKLEYCKQLGIKHLIVDIGFGFGKSLQHNYQLLGGLSQFTKLGHPLLVGISNKGMLYKPLHKQAHEVLPATTAAHTIALLNEANILRVHDVAAAWQAIQIVGLLKQNM